MKRKIGSSRRIHFLVTVCVTLGGYVFWQGTVAAEDYSFGIVPQQSAAKLAQTWAPVITYLQEKTGYKLHFETAKSIPVFEENLAVGKYDFAYMNPYHYVMFHRHAGYKAFAKEKNKNIKGIIVVGKDSPIKSLQDLNNKVVVFPSPMAFAASMIPRADLKHRRININPRYVTSHDSVYRNVADKNFIAGGGVVRTYEAVSEEVRSRLRILYTTKGYTPHAFAAHPKVPPQVIKDVFLAMQNMSKTEVGRELLEKVNLNGISTAKDADWDDVRKLKF